MNNELLKTFKANQRTWARNCGIAVDDDGYCTTLEDNLFGPLSSACRAEFAGGDGSELGKGGVRAKMQALHSSSALACNFFDYWRDQDLGIVSRVLGLTVPAHRLAFEQKFPTGLGGIAPNMDVVLHQPDGGVLAIESKFLEPYAASKTKNYLKPKYFPSGRQLWAERGLQGCQAVAEDLYSSRLQFQVLDAAQLLKHMLGLACTGDAWRLCCVWYQLAGAAGKLHSQELEEFSRQIGPDAERFHSLTYQTLFERIASVSRGEHHRYLGYMRDRYFTATTADR